MGSKNRYAKYLLPIILKDRQPNQWYVEPFCGGCNMIDKVDGNRIGNDINYYLISLFKSLQNGYIPPKEISLELYNDIRINKDKYPPDLVGFVGIPCSYAAKWFGGYCRGFNNKGEPRNYILEAWNNVMNQVKDLKGIEFYNKNYWELEIPNNSICYLDPPYFGTTEYKHKFDHDKFWKWCDEMVIKGHKVFVSEYSCPNPEWSCVFEKEVYNSLTKNTGGKVGMERLFTKI